MLRRFPLALAAGLCTALPARAQSIDETINQAFDTYTSWYVNFIFADLPGTNFSWIALWLVVAAVVFTIYFTGVQVWGFRHAIRLVKGDYSKPDDAGEVSHFQALATALSGTVGLGNIAGVAVAISIGGPGATFWMIVAGLFGMATKFTECTLGVKYRNQNADGSVSGGPMYYMTKGFREKGLPGGMVMAVIFCIFTMLTAVGAGNMFQVNQAHAQIAGVVGEYPGWITGVIFALVIFAVIVGGIKSIARVTEKVVPFMAIFYVLASLVILIINYDEILWAFGQIFQGAFTGLGVAGGFTGALIQGFRRAAFSNEAGVGSAAIAHSAVKTNEPVTEGYVALLEPFIDTVVICTMTALVIIITGVLNFDAEAGQYIWNAEAGQIATEGGLTGVELTSAAYAATLPFFPVLLAVAVVLFAFSTMISWSYYGLKAWTFLLGEGRAKEVVFQTIFCLFVVVGAAAELGPVLNFSDAALFSMAIVNVIALYILMPLVKAELGDYRGRLRSGEIQPTAA